MTDTDNHADKKTAGAFDVRNIIGALLTIYGVILLLVALFGSSDPASPDAPSGGGDINANLWAGLVMLVVGLGFIAWWRAKPIVVDEDAGRTEEQEVQRPDSA